MNRKNRHETELHFQCENTIYVRNQPLTTWDINRLKGKLVGLAWQRQAPTHGLPKKKNKLKNLDALLNLFHESTPKRSQRRDKLLREIKENICKTLDH